MSAAMKALVHRQKTALLHPRRAQLYAVIGEQGGVWKTRQVMRLYRDRGWGCCRSTARGDLQYLARHGFLIEEGPTDGRTYRLNQQGAHL